MRRRHLRTRAAHRGAVVPASVDPWHVLVRAAPARHAVLRRGPCRCGGGRLRRRCSSGSTKSTSPTWPSILDGTGTRSPLGFSPRFCGRAPPAAPPVSRSKCASSNRPAQNLYRSFGLAPVGVRKRYYEQTEDAIVMWLHDIDKPEYAERLASIEAALPGTTVVDPAVLETSDPTMSQPAGPDSVILGIETSCDETAAAVRGRRRTTCSRRWCRARSTSTRDSVASCPRSRAGPMSSCSRPSSPARSSRPASSDRAHRRCRGHRRPRPDRLPARRRQRRQGAGARVGRALRRR